MTRYPPRRVLTIGAWAGAAVTWVMALLGEPIGSDPGAIEPGPSTSTAVHTIRARGSADGLPYPPPGGLMILRFTPVAPPPVEVIVRTVSAPAPRQVVVTSQGS